MLYEEIIVNDFDGQPKLRVVKEVKAYRKSGKKEYKMTSYRVYNNDGKEVCSLDAEKRDNEKEYMEVIPKFICFRKGYIVQINTIFNSKGMETERCDLAFCDYDGKFLFQPVSGPALLGQLLPKCYNEEWFEQDPKLTRHRIHFINDTIIDKIKEVRERKKNI